MPKHSTINNKHQKKPIARVACTAHVRRVKGFRELRQRVRAGGSSSSEEEISYSFVNQEFRSGLSSAPQPCRTFEIALWATTLVTSQEFIVPFVYVR